MLKWQKCMRVAPWMNHTLLCTVWNWICRRREWEILQATAMHTSNYHNEYFFFGWMDGTDVGAASQCMQCEREFLRRIWQFNWIFWINYNISLQLHMNLISYAMRINLRADFLASQFDEWKWVLSTQLRCPKCDIIHHNPQYLTCRFADYREKFASFFLRDTSNTKCHNNLTLG